MDALHLPGFHEWQNQLSRWRHVVVAFIAALLAALAAGIAINASHYADAVVFVATGSVTVYLGVNSVHARSGLVAGRVRTSRSIARDTTEHSAAGSRSGGGNRARDGSFRSSTR